MNKGQLGTGKHQLTPPSHHESYVTIFYVIQLLYHILHLYHFSQPW